MEVSAALHDAVLPQLPKAIETCRSLHLQAGTPAYSAAAALPPARSAGGDLAKFAAYHQKRRYPSFLDNSFIMRRTWSAPGHCNHKHTQLSTSLRATR